jgi:hypothetical protein
MFRTPESSAGLSLVPSKSEERSTVYDISEAREAQRMRTRLAFHPHTFERRSNVLRFRTGDPIRLAVRVVEQPRERFRGATEGPNDLPPAA